MTLVQDRHSEAPERLSAQLHAHEHGGGDEDYRHGEVDIKTAPQDALLWYFAYGSNMDPAVLTGRRGVRPKRVVPCEAPGYQLVMSALGLPYGEPAFASVGERAPDDTAYPTLHGTANLVTVADYLKVRRTEGGGGHEGLGYQDLWLTLVDYKGRPLRAVTLLFARPGPLVVRAPSQRYMTLILRGARAFGLAPQYQRWLEQHGVFRPQSVGQQVGRGLMLAVFGTLLLPMMLLSMALARFGIQSPRVVHQVGPVLQVGVTWFHDHVGRHVLGNGMQANGVFDSAKVPAAEVLRQELKKYL